jgi:hypothetical protein
MIFGAIQSSFLEARRNVALIEDTANTNKKGAGSFLARYEPAPVECAY